MVSATFFQRKQAETWARKCEEAIDLAINSKTAFDTADWVRRGRDPTSKEAGAERAELDYRRQPDTSPSPRPDWSLKKALEHYEATVTPNKKGSKQEVARLAAWRGRPLAAIRLDRVSAADVQRHIDARLNAGRAAMTIRNEVLLLSAVYAQASAAPRPGGGEGGGWGLIGLINPVTDCHLPPPPAGRDRRLQAGHGKQEGEEARILEALARGNDAKAMTAVVVLAIETGMRLSEVLDVRPEQVQRMHGDVRYISRPDSKNGRPRKVVLSPRAEEAIDRLIADSEPARPLIRLDLHTVENRWRLACERAAVTDLTLHDLRHEALSRMAACGLTIGELQAQSGHRTAQVLLRYVNARADDVAAKLRQA